MVHLQASQGAERPVTKAGGIGGLQAHHYKRWCPVGARIRGGGGGTRTKGARGRLHRSAPQGGRPETPAVGAAGRKRRGGGERALTEGAKRPEGGEPPPPITALPSEARGRSPCVNGDEPQRARTREDERLRAKPDTNARLRAIAAA